MTDNITQIPRIKPSLLEVREREIFRFIQIYFHGDAFFRWGGNCHGIDFANFLWEVGIKKFGTFIGSSGDIPIARSKSKGYELVGAGWMYREDDIIIKRKSMSGNYNLRPNVVQLDELKPYLPEGVEFKVV